MNIRLSDIVRLAIVSLALATPLWIKAQDENTSSRPNFSEFQIILERNIFDPGRTPGYRNTDRQRERQPEIERLFLKGALIHTGEALAFFEGTKEEYNAVKKSGESIGGFKIKGIHIERIILEREGKEIEILVGSGLMKTESGEWELSNTAGSSEQTIPAVQSAPSQQGNTTGDDNDMSDIMRKMMERRQKETGQ